MADCSNTKRYSRLELNEVYFWTDTIKDWKHLLKQDKYKVIILQTWRELVKRELIKVYAFVIMPNHLHVVWEMIELNGKEMPYASFNKATSHEIIKDLKANHPKVLSAFKVEDKERSFRVWQRDPMGILMDGVNKVEQKIDYIHLNPLQERWSIVKYPEDYHWSSSAFYEKGGSTFDFFTHYKDRF